MAKSAIGLAPFRDRAACKSTGCLGIGGPPRRGKPYVPARPLSNTHTWENGQLDCVRFRRADGDVIFQGAPGRRQLRVNRIIAYLVTLTPLAASFWLFWILLLCGFGLPIPEDISLIAAGYIAWCAKDGASTNLHGFNLQPQTLS